jgi:tetratricopeptide (TPR) repeat protein
MFDRNARGTVLRNGAITAVLLVLSLTARAGSDFRNEYDQANHQYDQGNFEKAETLYKSIVDNGHYSAEVFYNLGNTEFRLKKPGPAILNYERALVLAPTHPEARANLAYVRDTTGANVGAKDWRDRIVADIDVNTYTWATAIAAWVFIFTLASILLKVGAGNPVTWLVAVCAVLILGYSVFAIWHLEHDESLAIITAKRAEARYSPADNSTLAATLPVGSRVWILERRGPWIYCALPDANRAWIASDSVERVRLKDS